jgi:hypothetical protein
MADEAPDFDQLIPIHNQHVYTNIIRKVDDELRAKGFYVAPPPVDQEGNVIRPIMPERLSILTREQILDLLGQYTAYLEYVTPSAADYALTHDAWVRAKTHLTSTLRGNLRGNATQVKDGVEMDPRFRSMDEQEFEALAIYRRVAAIEHGAETSRQTISRAITSQGQEIDRTVREHNVATNRSGQYGGGRTTGVQSRFFRPGQGG